MSPTDPNYGSYLQGQADAGPRGSWGALADLVGNGLRSYLEVLLGAPIGFGVIAGVVALLVGGNVVMAALIAAGVTFAVVLLIGLFYVTVRFAIAFVGFVFLRPAKAKGKRLHAIADVVLLRRASFRSSRVAVHVISTSCTRGTFPAHWPMAERIAGRHLGSREVGVAERVGR